MAAALMGLLVAGCELPDWLGESEGPPLPGERISVLSLDESLEPDPGISDVSVQLPQPWRNRAWPDAAGYPTNAMYHLEAGKDLKRAWRVDIGAGSGGEERLLARPIVAEGHIYTMDAETTVSAFDVKTGDRLWERDLRAEHESSGALGGGVAYDGGRLFVTTGYGHVYALEPASGKVIWDHKVGVPMRAPPLAADSRVFAITYDNQLFTLLQEDGREMWTHTGLPEDASLLGAPTAAATGDVVVVPYTSGELFALRVENGSGLWSDQLVRAARSTPLAALNEIRGAPVIDRNLVIAISHSGRMAAIDLRT
ncbi:MAG TPA: PQQ-binding-like beta-propeller repeat protein, partial [Alphaproteobacteria bacterium]|nr:PQQ-binding-like beta-propeller repeat protein [Alphaproteobacteria bacterium]